MGMHPGRRATESGARGLHAGLTVGVCAADANLSGCKRSSKSTSFMHAGLIADMCTAAGIFFGGEATVQVMQADRGLCAAGGDLSGRRGSRTWCKGSCMQA